MDVFVLDYRPCFYINTTKVLVNMKHWIELFSLRLLKMIIQETNNVYVSEAIVRRCSTK